MSNSAHPPPVMVDARSEPGKLSDALAVLRRSLDRPIVLVGLMGSGKSTVGRKVSHTLRCPFHDADEEIEAAAQRTITEIFAEFGEPYFREGESRVIERLMREERGVIATGGGAFCNERTRALILKEGIAVWLDCDVDTLARRTARRNDRPLLRNGDPQKVLERLHRERAPLYALAPIRIDAGGTTHGDTAARIVQEVAAWIG